VATIERSLGTTLGIQFTQTVLTDYANKLLSVIAALREASDTDVRRCVRSREAVTENIYEACDELQLALQQLIEKDERGKNRQFLKCLRNARKKLADALKYW